MRRSPRPIAATRWAARSPRSRRRPRRRPTIGRPGPVRGRGPRVLDRAIGMAMSFITRRAGMPRAASSPGMRPRSSSCSVPADRGSAYLIERDGFLFQSPITWYARQRRWDLSPGYEKDNAPLRPAGPARRACTATRTGSSRWRARSTGIGRRSSGATRSAASGATGLASSTSGVPTLVDGRDMTIVNPAALEPSLRDAVCEQCHLMRPSARRAAGPPG